jgi:hypothetical protein
MRAWGGLAVVLALALFLRLDGIGYGLDFTRADRTFFTNDTDARGMVIDVRERFLHGDIHPNTFLVRGPAAFHVFGVVDAVAVGAWACFHPQRWSGVLAELHANPSLLHLLHRLVSASAGVLTVLLVFLMMRRELDRTSAWLAALLLAVCYLHVRDSHLGTVDVLSGLATVLALGPECSCSCASRRARATCSPASSRAQRPASSTSGCCSASRSSSRTSSRAVRRGSRARRRRATRTSRSRCSRVRSACCSARPGS